MGDGVLDLGHRFLVEDVGEVGQGVPDFYHDVARRLEELVHAQGALAIDGRAGRDHRGVVRPRGDVHVLVGHQPLEADGDDRVLAHHDVLVQPQDHLDHGGLGALGLEPLDGFDAARAHAGVEDLGLGDQAGGGVEDDRQLVSPAEELALARGKDERDQDRQGDDDGDSDFELG
jgi:hypothetical protein